MVLESREKFHSANYGNFLRLYINLDNARSFTIFHREVVVLTAKSFVNLVVALAVHASFLS